MRILTADYVGTAVNPDQYPKSPLPEVAFVGRSNVGKSTLINKLCNRKALARVSSTPGKTATINFFRINDALMLVDLPGYGYAKVSKQQKAQWGAMIDEYLNGRQNLRCIVQIVDLRHRPSADDQTMYEWLKQTETPTIIAATKADKIPKGKWNEHLKLVQQALNVQAGDEIIPVSGETGLNKDALWAAIQARLS